MNYTYKLENLNCAHCAAKIETKIAETEGIENVSFVFATKLLRFNSDKENTLSLIQEICDSIEDGVTVIDNSPREHSHNEHAHTHEHSHGERSKLSAVLLILSIILGLSALCVHLLFEDMPWSVYAVFAASFAAALMSGYQVFLKGIKNIFHLRFDETALMTIAVIAAFAIGEFVEAAMVTIMFALGEFIEDKAVDKSRADIEKLAQIRPDFAVVLRDGKEVEVPAADVAVGSEIIVKPHTRIPLDGVIVEGATTIDASALTGESLPVEAAKGSEVLSGSMNGSNAVKIRTTKAFGDSTATRILKLVEEAAAQKGSSEKFISKFASVYTPIIIGIAVLLAALPPLLGLGDFTQWLYRALVVLVASCPCAIVISVPLSYYAGIGAASRHGVLIKGGRYLEALAKADAFVFDKTGTLTDGKLTVDKVTAQDGYTESEILALAAACEKYSSHPIALAIMNRAEGIELPKLTDYSEKAGYGVSAIYNGKTLCCGSSKILKDKNSIKDDNSSVYITLDGNLIGAVSVSDNVRNEASDVMSKLRGLGVKLLIMLTGDSAKNADSVSQKLTLSDYKAELLPQDKLAVVNEIKKNSKTVCFVGDGINDAPVLSASDCGIAMALSSEAAIEAADAVLSSGDLSMLPEAVRISRKTMNTVRTNIIFALSVKALVIVLAAFGLAAMWMSVIADTGVSVACVLYAARLLKAK